jgi:hypothetical protein
LAKQINTTNAPLPALNKNPFLNSPKPPTWQSKFRITMHHYQP